jgi:hypothetical protein
MIERTITQLTKFPEKKVLLITNIPHGLLFCLKRLSKLRRRTVTSIITNIFLEYVSKIEEYPRVEQPALHYQKVFVKYFRAFYPYPLKDKIKGPARPRNLCLMTDKIFIENVRHLALMEAMTVNEFVIRVLLKKMVDELQDPMLYKKDIPLSITGSQFKSRSQIHVHVSDHYDTWGR